MSDKKSVEECIAAFPEVTRARVSELRACIKAVMPEAEEGTRWGRLAFYADTILVVYDGFAHHVGLYLTPSTMIAMKERLSQYKTGSTSIQFPHDKPLPLKLIHDIVAYRFNEYNKRGVLWR